MGEEPVQERFRRHVEEAYAVTALLVRLEGHFGALPPAVEPAARSVVPALVLAGADA